MFLLVDNRKDVEGAVMTPKLIRYLEDKAVEFILIESLEALNKVTRTDIQGIILSGGPLLLSEENKMENFSKNVCVMVRYPDVPVLGICFGFQVMSVTYGGCVRRLPEGVFQSNETVQILKKMVLFRGIEKNNIEVCQKHYDSIPVAPPYFEVTAINPLDHTIQAIESVKLKRFGVQFHPENSNLVGKIVLDNFVELCKKKII